MRKLKIRFFSIALTIVFVFSLSLTASANYSMDAYSVSDVQTKRILSNSSAAQKLMTDIKENQIPQANDLMKAIREANSTSIALGNVDQDIIDIVENNISFSGVSVITSDQPGMEANEKAFTINLYQFSDRNGIASADKVLKAARSRPMSDTYSGGMNEYSVFGTIKINLQYNGTRADEFVITDVSAMTNWGTAALKTTKIVLTAVLVQGHGLLYDERPSWPISPVQSGVWYTEYPYFDGRYYNIGNSSHQMWAGADFYLSNGHSFSLGIQIQYSPEYPYGHYINYDDPWVTS